MTHFVIVFLKALQRHYRKMDSAAHISYRPMFSLQNVYSFKDILRYFKKGISFIVKMNFGIVAAVAIMKSYCRMSLDPKPLE